MIPKQLSGRENVTVCCRLFFKNIKKMGDYEKIFGIAVDAIETILKEYSVGRYALGKFEYVQNFSVATQETIPTGLFFNPAGSKMYIAGTDGVDVNEYNLSTPWDISTAVYLQNFSVVTQETAPRGLFFNPAGSKMYIIGSTGDDVNEYNLSTPWDISTAVYLQNFSVVTQETIPTGLFFNPAGSKMYIAGTDGVDVNEYNLSTPWDISTAVYLQNFSVATQETAPTGLFFNPAGSKMYIIGSTGDDVNEYNLSTPWDISTAVYLQNFSVVTQENFPTGLFFNPAGSKMYIIGSTGDDVNEYMRW